MNTDRPIRNETRPADDHTALIKQAIAAVAPELEPELADLDPDVDVWVEFELDSMDHLAVMTKLSEATGIDIPERDYPELTTLDSMREYLGRAG